MHCNFFRFLCKFCKEGACSFDAKRLWSAEPKGLFPLCGSKIHLRFQIAHEFYIRLCIAARTGRTARRVTIFECKHRQAARRVVSMGLAACGWLRGTSRTSPGLPAGGGGRAGCGALPLAGAASPGGLRLLRSASSHLLLAALLMQSSSHIRSRRLPRLGTQDKWLWRPTFVCICQSPRDPGGRRARIRRRHLAALAAPAANLVRTKPLKAAVRCGKSF